MPGGLSCDLVRHSLVGFPVRPLRSRWNEVVMMQVLAQDRPALITGAGEGNAGPPPPGTERVATLLELVGIGIFLALLGEPPSS